MGACNGKGAAAVAPECVSDKDRSRAEVGERRRQLRKLTKGITRIADFERRRSRRCSQADHAVQSETDIEEAQAEACSPTTCDFDWSAIFSADATVRTIDTETEQGWDTEGPPQGWDSEDLPGAPHDDDDGQSSSPERPDFTGEWVCVRVDGDWDAYLKETQVPWGMRLAVAGLGYGVGKQRQVIAQSGDAIHIANIVKSIPPREAKSSYRTDGIEEDILDIEGKAARSATRWEGSTLVTRQTSLETHEDLPTAHRFFSGEEMCTERVTPSGLVVRRFYARQK